MIDVNGLIEYIVIDAREHPLSPPRRRQRIGHQRLTTEVVFAERRNQLADCERGMHFGNVTGIGWGVQKGYAPGVHTADSPPSPRKRDKYTSMPGDWVV